MRNMKMSSPAELQQYFIKLKDGRLTTAEQERLHKWLASAPANQIEWDRLSEIWHLASPPIPARGKAPEILWRDLAAQLHRPSDPPRLSFVQEIIKPIAIWLRPIPRWAFAGTAILLLGILLSFFLSSPPDTANWMTVEIPFGQRAQVVLPDSSLVEINSGSTFKYPPQFPPERRQTKLVGEAFFHVRPDRTPFVVETAQATTQVLGTAFNVRTWNNRTRVFVQSGRVIVQSQQAPALKKIVLGAGQSALCDSLAVLLPESDYLADDMAWREGRLVFRRQILSEVLPELTRHYAIRIEADPSLLHHTITADFSQAPFAQVVAAVAAAVNAHYEKIGEVYRLQPN